MAMPFSVLWAIGLWLLLPCTAAKPRLLLQTGVSCPIGWAANVLGRCVYCDYPTFTRYNATSCIACPDCDAATSTCSAIPRSNPPSTECRCLEGYLNIGDNKCQTCDSCVNGVCEVVKNQATCVCPYGYQLVSSDQGNHCIPCPGIASGAPCSGQGTCSVATYVTPSRVICTCDLGWGSDNCSTCAPGYTGSACSDCAAGYVAIRGACTRCPGGCTDPVHGTCQSQNGLALCMCSTGWSGDACSRPDTLKGYYLVNSTISSITCTKSSDGTHNCGPDADCGGTSLCVCEAGYTTAGVWYDGSIGIQCTACPRGTYKATTDTAECTSCSQTAGLKSSTDTAGATDSSLCTQCPIDANTTCVNNYSLDPATCTCVAQMTQAGIATGGKVAIAILVPLCVGFIVAVLAVVIARKMRERREYVRQEMDAYDRRHTIQNEPQPDTRL